MGIWRRETLLPFLVAGTAFMENLDTTVIAPALPQMAESFGRQPVELYSGVSAYMLSLGLFIPISGWVAERFGTRSVLIWAIIIFTLASALCGLSQDLTQFVAARILQGIGGAMMVPVGRLIVLQTSQKQQLVKVFAILTWPALVAPVLGPPLGGLIADQAGWRFIFWLNLPLGVLAMVIAVWILPTCTLRSQQRFDWHGFALMGAALVLLMTGAEGIAQSETAPGPLALAVLLGAGLLYLGLRHLRKCPFPLFDLRSLTVPTFSSTIFGGSLFRMSVSAVQFLVPLMFQLAFDYDAFHAGLMLMAVFAGNLAMKPMTTSVMQHFGFRPVLIFNGLANALLIGFCAFFSEAIPLWLICFILFVGGMTRSMQFTAQNTIAFADIPKEEMASANTLFSTAFQVSLGMGIALGAIAGRFGDLIASQNDPTLSFRIAFLLIALVSAISVIDCFTLPRGAGDHVAKPNS